MTIDPELCPLCGADLTGEPIPVELMPEFGATHGSRKIGLYSLERDRVTHWRCPDCGGTWERDYGHYGTGRS